MIEVKNLSKKYGDFEAVKNETFSIEEGEIVGLIGPNGAGKSTTMNMITGFIEPTDGTILIDGIDIEQKPTVAKRKIGYMPENVPLYKELTVREFVEYMADLRKIKRKDKKEAVNKALDEAGIKDVQYKLISQISRGYRQRVSLAGAIVGRPPILILDEPTVGLDPKQVVEIRNLIKSFKGKHTVILSSHILSEVSNMCDKLIIINNGKIVKIDTTENFIKAENQKLHEIEITVEDEENKFESAISDLLFASEYRLIRENKDGSKSYLLKYSDTNVDVRKEISKALMKKEIIVLEMKIKESNLEDAYLDIINEDYKEAKMREEMQRKQKSIKVKLSFFERFGKTEKMNVDNSSNEKSSDKKGGDK